MITTVTARDSALPVELDEAKAHLRVLNEEYDAHIQSLLEAATEYCESVTGRALRVSHTLTQSYCDWPCDPVRLDRQPALAVTHVKYYVSDVLQTLASTNYRLHLSSGAAGYLAWDDDFTRPTHDTRDDAVIITYTAGYSTVADVPAMAKHAIKLLAEHWFKEGAGADVPEGVGRCLAQLDPGVYR